MVDPIADMLNRLRNGQMARNETVEVPFSQMKYAVAKILERRGFVKNVEFKGKKAKKIIEITLKYNNGTPRILGVRRVSKPGTRVYGGVLDMKKVHGGQGVAIVSTSKGLMTSAEAKKENIGGEFLCEVW